MKNFNNLIIINTLIAIAFLMSAPQIGAQRATIGFRFMPTLSAFDLKTSSGGTVSGEAKLGYGIGGLIGVNITKHVGVQGELIYSAVSQKYTEQNVERQVNLRYFNIPLLVSLNTGKSKMVNLNIVAGPQIGVSAGSSLKISGGEVSSPAAILAVKKGDLGFAYGAGLDFGINSMRNIRFDVGFRGVLGLLDISDNSNTLATDSYFILDRTHVKTNAIYVGLSFLF
jgi:hypothetical protein